MILFKLNILPYIIMHTSGNGFIFYFVNFFSRVNLDFDFASKTKKLPKYKIKCILPFENIIVQLTLSYISRLNQPDFQGLQTARP